MYTLRNTNKIYSYDMPLCDANAISDFAGEKYIKKIHNYKPRNLFCRETI